MASGTSATYRSAGTFDRTSAALLLQAGRMRYGEGVGSSSKQGLCVYQPVILPTFVLLTLVCLVVSCRSPKYQPNVTSLQPLDSTVSGSSESGDAPGTALPVFSVAATSDAGVARGLPLRGGQPMVRVALIGDQGLGERAEGVLDLIRDANADFAIVLGDFDYVDRPQAWVDQMARLGKVPWFAVIGNHDVAQWPQYQKFISEQQKNIQGADCRGAPGIQSVCTIRSVTLVLSGIGTLGDQQQHEAFIHDALTKSKDRWKLCLWHKTQHDMQLGAKTDEVGWNAFRTCQAAGAIVATGHEHSYSRTRTLTALGDASRGHGAIGNLNEVEVGPGRTFVVVSGLGGVETRVFVDSHKNDAWWGAFFTADRQMVGGTVTETSHSHDGTGALFLDLGIDGDITRGRGRFVTTFDRRVFDDFSIRLRDDARSRG